MKLHELHRNNSSTQYMVTGVICLVFMVMGVACIVALPFLNWGERHYTYVDYQGNTGKAEYCHVNRDTPICSTADGAYIKVNEFREKGNG